MPQIQVTINNRAYSVACGEGEEAHVGRLARYVERKVAGLVDSLGQVGDARLLLMASLMVADELAEAEKELAGRGEASASPAEPERLSRAAISDLAGSLDGLAQRIEAIATRLERD